ncbi:MAG: ATPase [Thermoplasmata archaeon]|nr:MAG: ATPase [Thermoplasmata archaeon]RLF71653.1 MAG: ATPase [Thermoplasmata archaeon]RLF75617.1 MAG: ATPase [Thermoplasmata archaeon]
MADSSIVLKVEAALKDDVGHSKARLSTKARRALNVSPGDIIGIKGKKLTAAVVWRARPEDEGKDIIRIDGLIRKNAQVSIGDKVEVFRADVKNADAVIIAPALKEMPRIQFATGIETFIKRALLKRPVHKGDTIFIPGIALQGNTLPFKVLNTSPRGIVQIGIDTKIKVSEEPVGEETAISQVTYEDIGGLKEELARVREIIELPLKHPELFERLGIRPPKGVLLYGPPGTGKTLIAKAVANESGATFVSIQGPEIMNKFYGQSEENLRMKFREAEKNPPAIIFIDEIDSIAPKRDEIKGEVERRVVAQLLTLMDGLEERGKVIVIGATNRVDDLDPALRRPGRFDREIEIGVPDREGREEILKIHTRGMPLSKDVDLKHLAEITHGFVGADLAALVREAAMKALRRYLPNIDLDKPIPTEILEKMEVTMEDFRSAFREIEPSALREVLVEIPKVSWSDIGGLEEVKQRLREMVEWPLTDPEAFRRLGIRPPKGVLLYGPPGSGKTLLAKAVAHESQANFISIKGPEILSKWVGESEKAIREIFKKARQTAPCILFFDEIDAIAPRRGGGYDARVTERIVNQLLTSMDGIESNDGLIVIGATNRPDILDPALLRAGRFDRLLLVGPPDEKARVEILKIHTKDVPLKGVDLEGLAKRTENFSGADLENLVREAALQALRENPKAKWVTAKHFEKALELVRPSLTEGMLKWYEEMEKELTGGINKKEKGDKGLVYYG